MEHKWIVSNVCTDMERDRRSIMGKQQERREKKAICE